MPFNRGILGKYASTDSISGLVTAKEQFTLAAGGFYPRFVVPSGVTRTISRLLSLLVKTDGSNGGDNTSITDSSTNSHTVSVYGDTYAGSFSPHDPDGYSAYIDGSGSDWIKTDTHADFAFGNGDFTVECWYHPVSKAQNYPRILHFGTFWQNNQAWGIQDRHNSYSTIFSVQSYSGVLLQSTTTVTDGKWYHIALERSGATITLYINGIAEDTYDISTNNFPDGSTTSYLNIGNVSNGANLSESEANGYVRDVRIVKGSAVYQGNFTPPTSTLTAVTNTVFLGLTKPYFTDVSGQGHTLTANGSISTDPLSPYRGAVYNPATHGGSVYFDGSGDYVAVADNTELEVGNGNFTLEGWFYQTVNAYGVIVSKTSAAYAPFWINVNSGTIYFYASSNNTGWDVANNVSFGSPKLNMWNHFAISREGNSIRLFLNGVLGATVTTSSALADHTSPLTIASQYNGANPFGGYISDVRLVRGTAVYTSAFTPPTAPLSSSGASLHIKGQDAAIYDATGFSNLQLVGNATTSTAVTKYAASSLAFDGTGDYITAQMDDSIISEDEDWTVEFWAYISNVSADNAFFMFGPTDSGTSANKVGFGIFESGTKLAIVDFSTASNNKNLFGNSTQLSSSTWHHIAFVKSGNQVAVFIDGTIDSTGWNTIASSITLSNRARAHIGGVYNLFYNGYMEDVRITKGLARYPWIPTKETVTAGANTQFLTAHAATITDGSGNSHSITTAGDVAVSSTVVPSSGMYSVSFDGAGDYLRADTALDFHSSTSSAFTIECWVNPSVLGGTGTSTDDFIGINRASDAVNVLTLSPVQLRWNNSDVTGVTDMSTGEWYHVALVYDGSTARYFINGRLDTTLSGSIGTALADCTLLIGAEADAANAGSLGNYFSGYISNLVISNSEVYTNDFTPPTAALI